MTVTPITKDAIQEAMAAAEEATTEDLRGMYPMACRTLATTTQVLRDTLAWTEAKLDELRDENKMLRYHLKELGKAADAAAMVIATIEAEDTTEGEKLQAVMDAIGTRAPDAIMGPNLN